MGENLPIRIYVNNIENEITLWTKTVFLMLETMKLLWSTKSKITKDENCNNLPSLRN